MIELVKKILLGQIIGVVSVAACASTCVPKSPEEISATAEVAFVGTLKSIENDSFKPSSLCRSHSKKNPKCGGKRVIFEVTETLRSDKVGSVSVLSQDACYCTGQFWEANRAYLVIAVRGKVRGKDRLIVDHKV